MKVDRSRFQKYTFQKENLGMQQSSEEQSQQCRCGVEDTCEYSQIQDPRYRLEIVITAKGALSKYSLTDEGKLVTQNHCGENVKGSESLVVPIVVIFLYLLHTPAAAALLTQTIYPSLKW